MTENTLSQPIVSPDHFTDTRWSLLLYIGILESRRALAADPSACSDLVPVIGSYLISRDAPPGLYRVESNSNSPPLEFYRVRPYVVLGTYQVNCNSYYVWRRRPGEPWSYRPWNYSTKYDSRRTT